jgi:hypothetical protein
VIITDSHWVVYDLRGRVFLGQRDSIVVVNLPRSVKSSWAWSAA